MPVTTNARLVGDGIENPANARALLDAAAMFAVPCLFRDSRGLDPRWSTQRGSQQLATVASEELFELFSPIVAVDNVPGADNVFASKLPAGQPSIVVGNERVGVRPDVLRRASKCVQIPMSGRRVNTLNVASAAAVALFYLLSGPPGQRLRAARPEKHRPAVLLLGPGDHVEAGSSLRSAAAFGWGTVGLDDRDKVWFGTPRPVRSEARAAARSHRNSLRIVPAPAEAPLGYSRAIVVGTQVDGPLAHRVRLTGGPGTVVVIPDEEALEPNQNWERLGAEVEFARIDFPASDFPYRYRLIASIVLAEIARQLGTRPADHRPHRPRDSRTYESALTFHAPTDVDLITGQELYAY
jgi:tRNA G18 (ribose-2'-O)-methylase SpoU